MSKYEAITKTARNQGLIQMHRDFPELSLAEIGQLFGISKQRVSKIIRRAGKCIST